MMYIYASGKNQKNQQQQNPRPKITNRFALFMNDFNRPSIRATVLREAVDHNSLFNGLIVPKRHLVVKGWIAFINHDVYIMFMNSS